MIHRRYNHILDINQNNFAGYVANMVIDNSKQGNLTNYLVKEIEQTIIFELMDDNQAKQ